jgi:putative ABC transport system ATP-binding protein
MATIDLIVLGMLKKEPLSAYDLQKLVEYRNISKWVKISTPSIYKKVIQLEEKGYISSHIEREGKMPEKSVYSLTEKGKRQFEKLMLEISCNTNLEVFNMAILETKDLRKIYGSGENEVHALDGVSISVEEGEFVAVIGTSGSGKSTLLNMIGGLDRPTSGSVTIRGKELLKMKDEELTIFRRRNIGFVFQNYNLLPVLNVYENIVYPIEIDGGKTDTRFVKEIIHTLGLEQKLKNMPNNLSGGQQQRVAIARALATKPAIILADEPTGNLDSKTSMDVILLMQSISRQFHQTTIMITHNEEIAQMADRTIRIEDGKVVSGGVRYAR